jgi:hypothetical protein
MAFERKSSYRGLFPAIGPFRTNGDADQVGSSSHYFFCCADWSDLRSLHYIISFCWPVHTPCAASLKAIPDGSAKSEAIALGMQVAESRVERDAHDLECVRIE